MATIFIAAYIDVNHYQHHVPLRLWWALRLPPPSRRDQPIKPLWQLHY